MNAFQMTQTKLIKMLTELKELQMDLKQAEPVNQGISGFLHEMMYHLKQMGRLIYYFGLINEEASPKDNYRFNKISLFRLKPKPLDFINHQLTRYFAWKLKRWKQEYQEALDLQRLSQIIIICKICLHKTQSNQMNYHSTQCLKRAEALHELNNLNKTIGKYMTMMNEIKQFLVTKAKLDMFFYLILKILENFFLLEKTSKAQKMTPVKFSHALRHFSLIEPPRKPILQRKKTLLIAILLKLRHHSKTSALAFYPLLRYFQTPNPIL